SNTVQISQNPGDQISVYPNPATRLLNISIQGGQNQRYQVILYNIAGQILYTGSPVNVQNSTLTYQREPAVAAGLYFLKVKNLSSGESSTFKIVFGER
ncbi:MAG TPA: T9SS type A sorting domain-containing protein, partial [Puia sp.]